MITRLPFVVSALVAFLVVPSAVVAQNSTCATDSDCETGATCFSQTVNSCSTSGPAGPCDPVLGCPPVAPLDPTCTATVLTYCVYRWALPCTTAPDCGAGFSCDPKARDICYLPADPAASTSSKLVPVPSSATGTATNTTTCTNSDSYPGFCVPTARTCAQDSDCPPSWSCGDPNRLTTGTANATATSTAIVSAPVSAPVFRVDAGVAIATASATGTAVSPMPANCLIPMSSRGTRTSTLYSTSVSVSQIGTGTATGSVTGASTSPPFPSAGTGAAPVAGTSVDAGSRGGLAQSNGKQPDAPTPLSTSRGCTLVQGGAPDPTILAGLLGMLLLGRARRRD